MDEETVKLSKKVVDKILDFIHNEEKGYAAKYVSDLEHEIENELEAINKEIGDIQPWRKFILERVAIDSSNEIYNKGINADALRGLCLEYDLAQGAHSGTRYMGLTFYVGLHFLQFFLNRITKTEVLLGEKEYETWKKQIAGLEKTKKTTQGKKQEDINEVEPLIAKPGGKEKGIK